MKQYITLTTQRIH